MGKKEIQKFAEIAVANYFNGMSAKEAVIRASEMRVAYEEIRRYDTAGEDGDNHCRHKEEKRA